MQEHLCVIEWIDKCIVSQCYVEWLNISMIYLGNQQVSVTSRFLIIFRSTEVSHIR